MGVSEFVYCCAVGVAGADAEEEEEWGEGREYIGKVGPGEVVSE